MSRVLALGFFKTKDIELVKKMVFNVAGVMPEILDLKSYKPTIKEDDVVIAFGKAVHPFKKVYKHLKWYDFVEVSKLEPEPGNDSFRQTAYEQLLDVKAVLELAPSIEQDEKPITEGSLPDLSTGALLEILKKTGRSDWKGITKDGRKIRLTVEPEVDTTVDLNLTFAELFLLRSAMETLHVKEFQFVTSPKGSK